MKMIVKETTVPMAVTHNNSNKRRDFRPLDVGG